MRPSLLWLAAAALAGITSNRVAHEGVSSAVLARRNYRGLELPATGGIAVLAGILTAVGFLAFMHILSPRSEMLSASAYTASLFVAAGIGFGLLGLWDDVAGNDRERGWRAHLSALRRGRPTAGALKIVGGAAIALVVAVQTGESFWWSIANALIIALSANAVNLFDKRPGRSSKVFLLSAVGIMLIGGAVASGLAAGVGAVLLYMPYDLRERMMLGDAGSNGLGALLGVAAVLGSTHGFRLLALGLLIAITVAGARPGLSRLIESVPLLRRFDHIGRVKTFV